MAKRKTIDEEEDEETAAEEESGRSKRGRSKKNKGLLAPDAKHTIIAVSILGFAVLSVISLMGAGGTFGKFLSTNLYELFGWGTWFMPLVIGVVGVLYYRAEQKHFTRAGLGMLLSVLSTTGIFNIVIEGPAVLAGIKQGRGGGYLGYAVSHWMFDAMGFWGALVILLVLLLIGIIVIFDASVDDIVQLLQPESESLSADDSYDEGEDLDRQIKERERAMMEAEKRKKEESEDDDESEDDEDEENEDEIEIPSARPREMPQPSALTVREERKVTIPMDLLDEAKETVSGGDVEMNKLRIKRTLQHFGIDVEMGEVSIGPTVTQYTLRPEEGVKTQQISSLSDNLALALAAHPIRIEAPIPGKSLIGIEVPNHGIATVRLRNLFTSEGFVNNRHKLPLALGKDVTGETTVLGLENMPHMLIAGATGSGKSVCINTLILSLMYSNSPDALKFIMVDPKRVEMTPYTDIPYLLCPVITENDKTINALKWCVGEMENRYKLLAAAGKKNIAGYNESISMNKLPYIVIVIDEMADLMQSAGREVEALVVRLAQMARAVGIHLMLATQRPSVDVITGLIKANIPGRVAFSVNSLTDSRTILDTGGAEKLLGKGDMLILNSSLSKPKRLQGAFVSEGEIERVTEYVRTWGKPDYQDSVTSRQSGGRGGNGGGSPNDEDPLYEDAKETVIAAQKASTSFLQRKLSVGYARAAKLIDLLEENGIVGPGDGAKPREVLAVSEDFSIQSDGGLTGEKSQGYDDRA